MRDYTRSHLDSIAKKEQLLCQSVTIREEECVKVFVVHRYADEDTP